MYIPRLLQLRIEKTLKDTPVLLITGPRQCGKSTLARQFSRHHITLDDYSLLDSLQAEPELFLRSQLTQCEDEPFIIDEAQLAPEMFRTLKKIVDDSKSPGMMILTGSANILAWEKMPDSLVGRIESIELSPLSMAEISEKRSRWMDILFQGGTIMDAFVDAVPQKEYLHLLHSGGFPEAVKRTDSQRREDWIRNYVNGLIERDARNLGNIESPSQLYKIIQLIAHQIGSTVNQTHLAQQVGISRPTLSKYLEYLTLLYLVTALQPWHRNCIKRLVKTPKFYLNDTGVLGHFRHGSDVLGPLVEQHVFCELKKQIEFSRTRPSLFFYRTSEGEEIDFILESRQGDIIGLEVKSAHQVSRSYFKNLISFQKDYEGQMLMGIVLYQGDTLLPFGHNLWAVPMRYLF